MTGTYPDSTLAAPQNGLGLAVAIAARAPTPGIVYGSGSATLPTTGQLWPRGDW